MVLEWLKRRFAPSIAARRPAARRRVAPARGWNWSTWKTGTVPSAIRMLPGFTTNTLTPLAGFLPRSFPGDRSDDSSTGPVNIGFNINFFGVKTNQVFVNNNGNITLGQASSDVHARTPQRPPTAAFPSSRRSSPTWTPERGQRRRHLRHGYAVRRTGLRRRLVQRGLLRLTTREQAEHVPAHPRGPPRRRPRRFRHRIQLQPDPVGNRRRQRRHRRPGRHVRRRGLFQRHGQPGHQLSAARLPHPRLLHRRRPRRPDQQRPSGHHPRPLPFPGAQRPGHHDAHGADDERRRLGG